MRVAKLHGPGGTGKTREILRIMTEALEHPKVGGDPTRLGFTTLTRIGRQEAAERAGRRWGVPAAFLEKEGYFKTTHSIAFRAVGVSSGEILGGGDDDQEWFEERLGVRLAPSFDDDGIVEFCGDRDHQAALMAWHIARVTLQPLRVVLDDLYRGGQHMPPPGEVIAIVERYEAAKLKDRRVDFDDLLGRFAGITFSAAGAERCRPEGDVPDDVVGWFLDEAQDSSKLLVEAQKRLLTGASVDWLWIAADAFQAVHTWNGADPSLFLNWPADRERTLSKSYRCPKPIVDLGERCLRRLGSDYVDRQVIPADHDGEVCSAYDVPDALDRISPTTRTLVLTRTNKHAARIKAMLKERDMPFGDIREASEPNSAQLARAALLGLGRGEPVSAADVGRILNLFPYKVGCSRLLASGCKKEWKQKSSHSLSVTLSDLQDVGASAELVAAIGNGTWPRFDPQGSRFVRMTSRWGLEATLRPQVRVGTIHSAKGTEAPHVVLCTGSSRPIYEQQEDSVARHHEECRVEYTAVTRASEKLTIARDSACRFQMDILDV